MSQLVRKLQAYVLAACLLAYFLWQGFAFLRSNSQTFDEAVHLTAGYSYLATGQFQLNLEDPPLIKELCALPVLVGYRLPFRPDPDLWEKREEWQIGLDFLYGSSVPHEKILFWSRVPNLLLGAILISLVGWWSYRLWGEVAGVFGMALAAFDPNLLAHSCVVTSDLGIALFTFLTLYLMWEYVQAPSGRLYVGIVVTTGLALATKYSALVLIGIVFVVIGLHLVSGGSFPYPGREAVRAGNLKQRLREAQIALRRLLLWVVPVVVLFYFVYGAPAWCRGVGDLRRSETGHSAFLMGQYSSHGWPFYFLVALLLKTPLGGVLAVLASLVLWRTGKPLGRHALFLLAPPVLFVAAMTLGRVDIGVRYILSVYPFLYVVAARLMTVRAPRLGPFLVPAIAVLLMAWMAVSTWRIGPHQLAYFNELAVGPDGGARFLSDSNLDWGQDLYGLKDFLDREQVPIVYLSYFGTAPPAAYGIHAQYAPGYGHLWLPAEDPLPTEGRELLAISVTNLQGVYFADKSLYAWLAHRQPLARIGYSIYVYDLTGDAEAHVRLAETYLKAGPPSLALPEVRKALALDPGNVDAKQLLRSGNPRGAESP